MAPEPKIDSQIGPQDAAAFLSDVARVETQTRKAMRYWITGTILILWGVFAGVGNLIIQFAPQYGWYVGPGIAVAGISGAFIVVALRMRRLRRVRARVAPPDLRLMYAMLAFFLFATVWEELVGGFSSRQLTIFIPMLFMLGFVVAGLWVGIIFTYGGLILSAVILAGYFWAGPWLNLWLAIPEGIAFIVGGFYLRRVGIER